jgi:peroxiredoxin
MNFPKQAGYLCKQCIDSNIWEKVQMAHMGEKPEDFVLKDQHSKEFRLSEHLGKRVLLSFHPLAWTDACAGQMRTLEDNYDRFDKCNTIAVGISIDSLQSKRAWAQSLSITHTRLLADFWPHGAVSREFGLFREKNGISERANILLDSSHNIIFIRIYPIHSVPELTDILGILEAPD